jgi:hypothetical protein
LSFNKKPYFVRVDYVDTVTAEDITNGTAGNKLVKTNPDGYLPIGVIPSETATKVRTLNGLVDEVSIVPSGLIRITSTQVGSSGTITISSLPPTFYPVVSSQYVASTGITFTSAETGTYKTGANVYFGTSWVCDIQVLVSGKFSGTNLQHFTPRISLAGSTYELPEITSQNFALSYLFPSVAATPALTGQVLFRATPSGVMTGTVTATNLSVVVTALPRIN